MLIKKCGPPKQEVHFERNENHRPIGRPDELSPSRHERVPPSCIVLMFNCFEASFDLAYGDIATLPESDTSDLRSLTSGKVLGRVKVTPEKGAHHRRIANSVRVGSPLRQACHSRLPFEANATYPIARSLCSLALVLALFLFSYVPPYLLFLLVTCRDAV